MASVRELEEKAREAFMDDDFGQAALLFTQAIQAGPPTAALFAERAQAFLKMGNFAKAAADATMATDLDPTMHRAYLRKVHACISLHQYGPARAAAEAGAALAPGDARFCKLIKELDDNAAAAVPVIIAKPRYRHDYYNAAAEVVVTVFAKGVPVEHVAVQFGEQMLSLSVEIPGEAPYHLQPRLFSKIVPGKCKFAVMSTKIELRLAKADEQVTWTSLEYTGDKAPPKLATAHKSATQRPAYPSSSKGQKDWDKIEAHVKKEEKEEKLDGDAAANKFFRDIYGGADEDMRRAMMKSFVESNGTVLSTSWEDVGSKTIETSAPEGMELRKWEY